MILIMKLDGEVAAIGLSLLSRGEVPKTGVGQSEPGPPQKDEQGNKDVSLIRVLQSIFGETEPRI
jgi:hypothetical protein